MEAEVKAARERQLVPLDQRMTQFQDLLTEKKISAFSTWEKELHKIVFDSRYLLLTSKERKQVFEKYVRERADEVIYYYLIEINSVHILKNRPYPDQRLPQHESLYPIGLKSARIEIPHIGSHYIDFSKTDFY